MVNTLVRWRHSDPYIVNSQLKYMYAHAFFVRAHTHTLALYFFAYKRSTTLRRHDVSHFCFHHSLSFIFVVVVLVAKTRTYTLFISTRPL